MSFRVSFASVMRKIASYLTSVMRKIASYLTKNRSETGRKIAQSTHENEYIKQKKTFCRNSKQFLKAAGKSAGLCVPHQVQKEKE